MSILFKFKQGYLNFLSKLILIVLSVLLMVFLINYLVLKSIDPRLKVANYTFIAKYNTFKNSQKKYDTLFFGSSRILRQINVDYFDSLTGFESFNFGTQSCLPSKSNYLLEKLIDLPMINNLKTIVIELIPFYPSDYKVDNESQFMLSDSLVELEGLMKFRNYFDQKELISYGLSGFLALFYKYSRSLKLFLYSDKNQENDFYLKKSGYESVKRSIYESKKNEARNKCKSEINIHNRKCDLNYLTSDPIIKNQFLEIKNKQLKEIKSFDRESGLPLAFELVESKYIDKVERVLKRLKDKNIKIYFLIPQGINTRLVYHQYAKLLADKSVKVIDLSSKTKNPELYEQKNIFDEIHLNYHGAKFFSSLIAREMLG